HNPPPPPPPPPPSMDEPSSSTWDWTQLLDFNLHNLPEPLPLIPTSPEQHYASDDPLPIISNSNPRVRKRDPRMACSNFLAGRIPCACPELDAQLAAEEEQQQQQGLSGKKKKKTRTAATSNRCQVPGCESDISELKGYHKRHRVCLHCANATSVVLDGQDKRYCQQCGKFHVLIDFDEGKRSCRRKLERHNNRRRRKPTESKGSGLQSAADYDDGCDEAGKGEGPSSSTINALAVINSDSIPFLAASGETQTDEDKEKATHSSFDCDDKVDFSSMCTTGRVSFKLYDWNPAEFPRRLRHQIFQWLANMPVELEGYIRPGCTILTIFIAMPRFMWIKLSEDPVVSIHDLLASPRNLLSGRQTFFVSLDNAIFSVIEGGRSVTRIKAGDKSPKLHYIQPTCFEAGKPIEFLACGSNLLQPNLRFLVSFAGKYIKNDARVTFNDTSTTNSDHQFLSIRANHTDLNVFGPGFIEVENESGLSNFIPILVAEEEICSEIKILQMKYYSNCSRDSESSSCEVAVNKFSELLVDMAWLLKQPIVEDAECAIMSSQLQRFTFLLNFLIEYKSTMVLKRVLHSVKMRVFRSGISEADKALLQELIDHATEVSNQRMEKKENFGSRLNDSLLEDGDKRCEDEVHPFISTVNQVPPPGHEEEKIGLLNADCVMSVTPSPYKEQPHKSSNNMFGYKTHRFFTPRPLMLAVGLVTVCFGICAVVFHPQKATAIAITIHRCLFDKS
ncbi:squamosa promoter-binding-like protein 7, partial [Bidens hawaiensis]|uniref:squamosa promoter-binding-like protein 7 n=1 Tax=Bidens hawaiensis TaxID=980011 RepID=UPI00404AAB1D